MKAALEAIAVGLLSTAAIRLWPSFQYRKNATSMTISARGVMLLHFGPCRHYCVAETRSGLSLDTLGVPHPVAKSNPGLALKPGPSSALLPTVMSWKSVL